MKFYVLIFLHITQFALGLNISEKFVASEDRKTVLVLGGAGFIGSHVNKLLYQNGYNTVVLDNLSKGNENAVTHGAFIKGDFGDVNLLDKIFTDFKIDAVMHFAAYIEVGESVKEPLKYYQNNVAKTLILLEAMVRHEIPFLIFSSSAAVYGTPQYDFISEDLPCNPINPYGESKLMVEKVLRDVSHAYNIKCCSLRYFNVAGGDPEGEIKNYKQKESNLIPIVLRSLLQENSSITIFGTDFSTSDGSGVRDYIHVYDIATAHVAAMEHLFEGTASECYNLGNSHGYSVREVVAAAEKVTGLKVRVIEGSRREGDPAILLANAERAQRELNWHPHYPKLEDMIEHAWNALH